MEQPLVTIIGLSYNQAAFIPEALHSVALQTYSNIEVILLDDASSDNSPDVLQQFGALYPQWKVICLTENLGNTRAFNYALALAKGEYIIDFALDDVLHPERIEKQVKAFEALDEKYGVVFTETELIDPESRLLRSFYSTQRGKTRLWPPPQGDVFAEILNRTFISTPSMMIKKKVLEELGGYNEALAYEDFDFWVRASRYWWFYFLDLPLVKKRIWPGSMSQKFYQSGQLAFHQSTLQVCCKAAQLVRTKKENEALAERIRFQARQAFITGHQILIPDYKNLLQTIGCFSASDALLFALYRLPISLDFLYRFYHRLRGVKQIT